MKASAKKIVKLFRKCFSESDSADVHEDSDRKGIEALPQMSSSSPERLPANGDTERRNCEVEPSSTAPGVSVLMEESSLNHLFRHVSEITRETKGGYLHGRVRLAMATRPLLVRLSLVPPAVDADANPFHLHPNLLHVNTRANKKIRALKEGDLPEDVDWAFVFLIKDEVAFLMCPPTNPSLKRARFHKNLNLKPLEHSPDSDEVEERDKMNYAKKLAKYESETEPLCLGPLKLPSDPYYARLASLKDGTLDLGSAGLMLNVISPLQKPSKIGVNLAHSLQQRFEDLFGRSMMQSTLNEAEKAFTTKNDRIRLHQVRLLVEVFNGTTNEFITSNYSEVITNSKSKECGPLQLHDVNPAVSCCLSESKIFLLSFFKLVADAKAIFILYDPVKGEVVYNRHHELMRQINQPAACSVFNQCVIIFSAPKQDAQVIKRIESLGLQLRITAYRPADKKMANSSFAFRYEEHVEDCPSCMMSDKREVTHLPLARPGVQRRLLGLSQPVKVVVEDLDLERALAGSDTPGSAEVRVQSDDDDEALLQPGPVPARPPQPMSSANAIRSLLVSPRMPTTSMLSPQSEGVDASLALAPSSQYQYQASASPFVIMPPPKKRVKDGQFS